MTVNHFHNYEKEKEKIDKKRDMYCGSPGEFDIPADVQ